MVYSQKQTEYFWMKHFGKLLFAAEGVTLWGVRKDEDRMLTELWRHPLGWGPKVQAQLRQTLRQKDKDL
jgi:hypothetical protein